MRRRLIFFAIFIALGLNGVVCAQCDTVLKYPYFYFYGWPDTIGYFDSTLCMTNEIQSPLPDYNIWYATGHRCREFALYQHTDKVLHAVGIAFCDKSGSSAIKDELTLYDSSMNILARDTSGLVDPNQWYWGGDTVNYKILKFPGMQHNFMYDGLYDEIVLKKLYFKDPIDVIGDFWIGIAHWYPNPVYRNLPILNYAEELHDPPLHFTGSRYRLLVDSVGWCEDTTWPVLPLLFLIIVPQCDNVDSLEVVTNTDSCIAVRWNVEGPQTHWMVKCESADGTTQIIEPVDTNYWEYCGVQPNTTYTISVQARCDFCGDMVWSPGYCNAVYVTTPNNGGGEGIEEAMLAGMVTLSPNPTSGAVHIEAEGVREVWLVAADGRRTQLQCKDGTVSLAAFAPGLYVLEVQTADGLFKAKVVRE